MKNEALWRKIEGFKLDEENSVFNFSTRLARDNRWSIAYSKKVISEYKKFLYLCSVGYGEVTPSDAVDQAWHLHLTYTKSYWIDLCDNTIGKAIHHNPTKGGQAEKEKYNSCYETIFDIYYKEFQANPPKDIWPDITSRFSGINYKRINLSDYWLIRKPRLTAPILSLAASVLLLALFIQSRPQFPWFTLFFGLVIFIVILRAIFKAGDDGKGGSGSGGSGGLWIDGTGCGSDSDHSGCSSHGCSSGCSSCGGGCGGGGD